MKEEAKVVNSEFRHTPVLANQVLEAINHLSPELRENSPMIDLTLGGGGHSALVLEKFPSLNLIGIDQDPNAINAASQRLVSFNSRTTFVATNFANFSTSQKACLILADLGVSSPQLDEPSRGFSFRLDGPLDMRMNPSHGITAERLLEKLNENELANLIYKFGEERFSRRIAKKIKQDLEKEGPYSGTKALADSIASCYPSKFRYRKIHPATKTFQALRIAINNELESLESLLMKGPDWIVPGGLFIIISFHSLEDRMVKNTFKNDIRLEKVTRKPLIADTAEISINPRSRSAKLRIAQRKKFIEN